MPANAQAFARRVLDAFEAAGRATDAQVIAAGGPSTSTMTKLRKVAEGDEAMTEPREPTWSKIDRAADWAPGSARRLWRGVDPISTNQPKDHQDLLRISYAFDELPMSARRAVVEMAHSLTQADGRPNVVVRREGGERLGLSTYDEFSVFTEDEAELALDLATDVLFEQPEGSQVVVQLLTPTGENSGALVFKRVAAPLERVRLAEAARDIGKPSRGQQKRALADRAGEPAEDDPDDMEPR